jgi:hypothetical protein
MTKGDLLNMPLMKTATEKIGRVAMLYDRDRSITGLQGFEEGAPMTPAVLKDQLWKNFHLRLTPKVGSFQTQW